MSLVGVPLPLFVPCHPDACMPVGVQDLPEPLVDVLVAQEGNYVDASNSTARWIR